MDQRAEVLAAVRDTLVGARIIDTHSGPVLVAAAVVTIPAEMRPDRAFSLSAAAALIEARAEAALFLAGEYGSTTDSGSTASSTNGGSSGAEHDVRPAPSDGFERKVESWVRLHASSQARTRFTAGEPLEIARVEGGVRAVVAWGLSSAQSASAVSEASLGAMADKMLGESEVAACRLDWVECPDGREGLRFAIVIHPEKPLGPCTVKEGGGCSCVACRKRVLEMQVQRTIGGWSKQGDVAVVRTLTRLSKRTETRAKDGAVAVEQVSSRLLSAKSGSSLSAVIPGDFFRKSVVVYRHSDSRSVCVGFVPIEAVSGEGGK